MNQRARPNYQLQIVSYFWRKCVNRMRPVKMETLQRLSLCIRTRWHWTQAITFCTVIVRPPALSRANFRWPYKMRPKLVSSVRNGQKPIFDKVWHCNVLADTEKRWHRSVPVSVKMRTINNCWPDSLRPRSKVRCDMHWSLRFNSCAQ